MNAVWFGSDNTALPTSGSTFGFITAVYSTSWNTTESNRTIPIPEDVTITRLWVRLDTAPGGSASYTFTVRDDAADTSASVAITGAATSNSWTGSANIASGSLIALEATAASTPSAPTNVWWIIEYTTATGNFILLGSNNNNNANNATQYGNLVGGIGTAWSTTDGDFDIVVPDSFTATKLTLATPAGSPGTGKSYTGSIRRNNTTDNLSVTVSDAETIGSTTGSVAWSAGDLISFKSAPSGTPTARRTAWGVSVTPGTTGQIFNGFGGAQAPSTSANNFEQMHGNGNNGWNSSESVRQDRPPAVDYKNLYVKLATDPSPGNRTFALMDNGSPTALSATVNAGNTTANDTTHTVTFSAEGNVGTIRSAVASSPAATAGVHIGYVMVIPQTSGDLSINVSDSITVTESIHRLLESSIAKTENITVTENVQMLLESFVNKSESITISEAIQVSNELNIIVSDTVTLTENTTTTLINNISTSDTITVRDGPSAFGNTTIGSSATSLGLNILYGNGWTPSVSGHVVKFSAYFDTAGGTGRHFKGVLVDWVNKTIVTNGVSNSSVAISTSAAGWYDVVFPTPPVVTSGTEYLLAIIHDATLRPHYDAATIDNAEDDTNSYSTPTDPTDGVFSHSFANNYSIYATLDDNLAVVDIQETANVSDLITVNENTQVVLESNINNNDLVTVTEAINTTLVHTLAVSDNVTISENINVDIANNVAVSDTITLTEAIAVNSEEGVAEMESISVSENVIVAVSDPEVAVSDSITISENTNIALAHQIAVSDSITLTESNNQTLVDTIAVSDSITTTESISVVLSDPQITVSDTISVSENTSLLIPELYIAVSDSVTLSENTTVFIPELFINVSDNVSVTDTPSMRGPDIDINVSDSITISENFDHVVTPIFVDVNDTITVSEQLDVLHNNTRNLAVADTITVSDVNNIALVHQLAVSDSITLSESVAINPPHIPDPAPKLIFVEGRLAYKIVEAGISHYIFV